VIDGESGFLAPERDEEALAGHMAALLDSRDLRLAMGAKARALVEGRFDLRRQTALLEDHYDSVLHR